MRRVTRIILLIATILAFLAIAPVAIFYALGFRITKNNLISPQSVGVVIVESSPRRADITINEKMIGRTPQGTANIPLGSANVLVSRPGYQSWQKNISVVANRATELRFVRLFPEALVPESLRQNITMFSLSPNRRLAAVLNTRNQLEIMTESGTQVAAPQELSFAPDRLLWGPDNDSVLALRGSAQVAVITWREENLTARNLPLTNIQDIVWDPRLPGRLLVLQENGQLTSLTLASGQTGILAEDITAFATTSRRIVVATAAGELRFMDSQGQAVSSESLLLPGAVTRILATPQGEVALQLASSALLYLNENELETIATQAVTAGWSPDGTLLYVQPSSQELFVFNAASQYLSHLPFKQLHLIARLSRNIAVPQWFAGGQHLLYQTGDALVISEIDTRDHPVATVIDTTNLGDAKATVGEDGEALFYLKREGNSRSLVRTNLLIDK